MSGTPHRPLLDALLDSWDRNNTILLNLLHLLPEGSLAIRSMEDGPSIGELFGHVHYVRLAFIEEDAPAFASTLPEREWHAESDPRRMAELLRHSGEAVRNAVEHKVETGEATDLHYDHPILLLQHMIWHEGYHHGQIKLALKLAGHALADAVAGPVTWRVWMDKR